MKRLLILFTILVGLGGVAYFINTSESEDTISGSSTDRDFAFPREEIGKLTIEKVGEPMQTFTRKGGGIWFINEKYKVSEFTMPYLLQAVSDLVIQNIPSKNATKNILSDIERVGIKIKVYNLEGEEVRSYNVGLEAADGRGTSFLMDGASQPYNMTMKGFDGLLRKRFLQQVDSWRDKEIFQYKATDISEIGIKYHKDEKSSFKLVVEGDNISVEPLSQFITPTSKAINQDVAKAYLNAYSRIYAEDYDNGNIRKDSISSLIPFATVAVMDKAGKINEVSFYPFRDLLLKNVNTKDLEDARAIERFFINHNKGDFMVAQNRLVKDIFRPYDFFFMN